MRSTCRLEAVVIMVGMVALGNAGSENEDDEVPDIPDAGAGLVHRDVICVALCAVRRPGQNDAVGAVRQGKSQGKRETEQRSGRESG